jgi:hypothetical protein
MVALRLDGRTTEFPAIFDVIERLVMDGDPYVQELAVIGYLEGFQMMTVTRSGLDPERTSDPGYVPSRRCGGSESIASGMATRRP